ncbi:hypothetical protein MNV49_004909 [Pseudohyphozyma bogoriensis]|nr:hypothetical protein MNV49_004909 [Pseudohyphozyma bogoriensis]
MVCTFTAPRYYGPDVTLYTFPSPTTISTFAASVHGGPGYNTGNYIAGEGDVVSGTLSAAPFAGTAYIYVGTYGGTGNYGNGNGGGFSSIGINANLPASDDIVGPVTKPETDGRIVVSGGGGAAVLRSGGGNAGLTGADGAFFESESGGYGATQSESGAGAYDPYGDYYDGHAGYGCHGGDANMVAGGGGGGGLYGGGGGGYDDTGGGGGSSFLPNDYATYAPKADFTSASGGSFYPSVTMAFPLSDICTLAVLRPSGVPPKLRRRTAAELKQDYLAANPVCPHTQRACPLPSGNFECVDFDELSSCGGCVTTGSGVDCLALPGVQGVQCIENTCVASHKGLMSHTSDDADASPVAPFGRVVAAPTPVIAGPFIPMIFLLPCLCTALLFTLLPDMPYYESISSSLRVTLLVGVHGGVLTFQYVAYWTDAFGRSQLYLRARPFAVFGWFGELLAIILGCVREAERNRTFKYPMGFFGGLILAMQACFAYEGFHPTKTKSLKNVEVGGHLLRELDERAPYMMAIPSSSSSSTLEFPNEESSVMNQKDIALPSWA